MGLHPKQFKELVLSPTLEYFHPEIPYIENSEWLVFETIWHESGGLRFLAQWPKNGPGIGPCSMEEETWDWLIKVLKKKVLISTKFHDMFGKPELRRLFSDLALNVFMTRFRYFVVKNPLPKATIEARADFWNRFYQTVDDQPGIDKDEAQYIADAYDLRKALM